MTWPALTVSAAFGVDPLTVPSGGQWIDISAYVRSLEWQRGRNHELSRTSAGFLSMRLRNTDRRFDPTHASGPYFPNVRPMTRIRVRAVHSAVTYDLWQGYVKDWGQGWDPRPINAAGGAEVEVQAVDAFELLTLFPLQPYSEEVLRDEPVGYWKLDEPAGSAVAADLGSTSTDLPHELLHVKPGSAGPFAIGGQTATDFDGDPFPNLISPADAPDFTIRRGLTLECWMRPESLAGGAYIVTHGPDLVDPKTFSWGATTSGFVFDWNVAQTVTFTTDPVTSAWHHYAIVRNDAASLLDLYVDGVLTESKVIGGKPPNVEAPIMVGTNMDGQLAHVAVYDYALSPERIAAHASRGFDGFVAQLSGAHLEDVLDAVGWPVGERVIDTGTTTIQAAVPTGNALEWLLRVAEDSEHGLLQMTGDGKVRFHSRSNLLGHLTAAATYGDDAADTIQYRDLEATYDDQDLFSAVEVPREDGGVGLAEDATSVADYGPRTLVRPSSLASSDEDVQGIATYLLEAYKAPRLRLPSLVVDPFNNDTRWTQVLTRDIHADRLTVKRRPPGGGSAISQDVHVQGVRHAVAPPLSWLTSFDLVPAHPLTFWILDDATYSVLGSTTRLA